MKKGIRWRLYLPGNDMWMNTVNAEQSAANRSNVDFKPLIDHFSAIECAPSLECSLLATLTVVTYALLSSLAIDRFHQVRHKG